MKLDIDQNNLLVIENTNISQNKEYSYNIGGYSFSSYDKGIIVYHKKQFKTINLKNLGDKMGIFYVNKEEQGYPPDKGGKGGLKNTSKEPPQPPLSGGSGKNPLSVESLILNNNSLSQGLLFFQGFNEETGKKYSFLPKFHSNELERLNQNLKKLGSKITFEKSNLGFISESFEDDINFENIQGTYSFLFGLLLAHGKLNIKNGRLNSAQIQIPLFGIYKSKLELFQKIIDEYSKKGIFIKSNLLENQDGIILQLSITDYKLLGIFANFYKDIEKIDGITKYDQAMKIKEELIEYLKTNPQIPITRKEEVLKTLENGIIKILQ